MPLLSDLCKLEGVVLEERGTDEGRESTCAQLPSCYLREARTSCEDHSSSEI